jgi:tetratricopeptide (TPR) repeat protein
MAESDPAVCPSPDTLGAFVDGRVNAVTRRFVQRHLTLCSECVFVVAGTSRILAAQEDEGVDAEEERSPNQRGLVALAAAIVVICGLAAWYVSTRGDPLERLQSEAERASFRAVEGRLAGFAYVQYRAPRSDTPITNSALRIEAERVIRLEERDARIWHARGVAALLLNRHDASVQMLERAARLAPRRAPYWNDLAVARLATAGGANSQRLEEAQLAAELAINIDGSLAAAHFNRALALDRLGSPELAAGAYERCITLDGHSAWAGEARRRREALRR